MTGLVRIGELSRRSGVSPELLRAWERRYELLRPTRSAGGLRLYSQDDLQRVQTMQRHLAAGLAAAEAASLAKRLMPTAARADADERAELAGAFAVFDEPRAQASLDRLVASRTLDALLVEVILPYLHELGDAWQRGEASIAQEHFASNVIRGRLLGLSRGWGLGGGPLAVLACLPGEQHELGLLSFGLALNARGWRIAYLGPDTPLETVAETSTLRPDLTVLTSVDPERLRALAPRLRALSRVRRLALAGAGTTGVTGLLAALTLAGDPVAEAERITTMEAA